MSGVPKTLKDGARRTSTAPDHSCTQARVCWSSSIRSFLFPQLLPRSVRGAAGEGGHCCPVYLRACSARPPTTRGPLKRRPNGPSTFLPPPAAGLLQQLTGSRRRGRLGRAGRPPSGLGPAVPPGGVSPRSLCAGAAEPAAGLRFPAYRARNGPPFPPPPVVRADRQLPVRTGQWRRGWCRLQPTAMRLPGGAGPRGGAADQWGGGAAGMRWRRQHRRPAGGAAAGKSGPPPSPGTGITSPPPRGGGGALSAAPRPVTGGCPARCGHSAPVRSPLRAGGHRPAHLGLGPPIAVLPPTAGLSPSLLRRGSRSPGRGPPTPWRRCRCPPSTLARPAGRTGGWIGVGSWGHLGAAVPSSPWVQRLGSAPCSVPVLHCRGNTARSSCQERDPAPNRLPSGGGTAP